MPPYDERHKITVRVEEWFGDSHSVKIGWSYDGAPIAHDYRLPLFNVATKATEIHDLLKELRQSVREDFTAGVNSAKVLAKIAREGRAMYELLFVAPDGPESHAKKARENLEREILRNTDPTNHAVRFVLLTPRLQIPWGLIFGPQDPPEIGMAESDCENYSGFWCDQFLASATYGILSTRPSEIAHTNLATLNVLEKAVMEKDLGDVQGVAVRWDSHGWHPIYGKDEFLSRLRKASDKHRLVYFFGHASKDSLQISQLPEELVSPTDFVGSLHTIFDYDEKVGLVILNGCDTASGVPRDRLPWAGYPTNAENIENCWLTVTSQQGLQGFIGFGSIR
jgi:hypothetical protein